VLNPLDNRTLTRAVHYEISWIIRVGIKWWEILFQLLEKNIKLKSGDLKHIEGDWGLHVQRTLAFVLDVCQKAQVLFLDTSSYRWNPAKIFYPNIYWRYFYLGVQLPN